MGAKYVVFSEGARQYLEYTRECGLERSATAIKKWWRSKIPRRTKVANNLQPFAYNNNSNSNVIQNSASNNSTNNMGLVLKTLQLHGLEGEMPPPLPPRRNYKVNGNQKIFNQLQDNNSCSGVTNP